MSYNSNPQPRPFPPSFSKGAMFSSSAPGIINPVLPGSLNFLTQNYWEGAVQINPGNSLVGDVPIFGNHQRGVISFWMQYVPIQQTDAGFPRIGQNGNINMLAYFGTDPAHASIGSIDVELVPITTPIAHWFAMEDSGMMWASADGVSWTSFQGPINGGFVSATYGNGMWLLWGLEYSSDQVYTTGIVLATTDLFNFVLVDREGPSGGSITSVQYISTENRFKITIMGRYQQGPNPIIIYFDNPFPPQSFGGSVGGPILPPAPNNYPTSTNGNTYVQFRGATSNSEIWVSSDKGQTWQKVAETTFATCNGPWGYNGFFAEQPGTQTAVPSAPGTISPLIPVGNFHKRNGGPTPTWEVSYFTKGFDASIGQGGAGIHVTRFGLPNPGNPNYDNNTTQMQVDIENSTLVEWVRELSGSPPGGNYLEFCSGGGTYGGGTDRPSQAMMDQCLAGFNFAVANPGLFVLGSLVPEGQKYEFPSLSGYYPLG